MGFQARAPKPIVQREYTDVNFVFGEDWVWQIPTYFTVHEIAKVRQVAYTHAHIFLVQELNSATPVKTMEREPSMISKKEEAAELIIRTFAEQKKSIKIIPDDKLIESVIGRFLANMEENEQSLEVSKEQLDLICLPKNGAPKLSTVFDRADRGMMQDAINFFYTNPNGMTKPKEEPPQQVNDSTKEESISETTTETAAT